jgi:hypothetical protein
MQHDESYYCQVGLTPKQVGQGGLSHFNAGQVGLTPKQVILTWVKVG